MNIALYFGSFNPIHKGHLAIAKALSGRDDVDELWLVVSPQNPLKSSDDLASEHHRLSMAKDAIAEAGMEGCVKVCDIEFSLPKPSYTINTLDSLAQRDSNNTFSLVMGGDNIVAIEKWKDWQRILDEHKIFVYPREGSERVVREGVVYLEDVELYEVSSTQIRKAETIKELDSLMESTKNYIIENKLYEK